ncbi:hypothetical protein LTR50_001827 [Elasticomyces elasticus]|nr:hypothetical protein LTR50_001827 [Elasticomyces elasticus]
MTAPSNPTLRLQYRQLYQNSLRYSLLGTCLTHRPALWNQVRKSHTAITADPVPLRKQLKDEARRKKAEKKASPKSSKTLDPRLSRWELTVGLEIHAELNTACKLFSPAATSLNAEPNSHVALFDAAFPGTQPQFQKATLIPALRAALAFGCEVQRKSSWDRKHYFYQDQPNGYQITQYYEPFARGGTLTLTQLDGIETSDCPEVTVGIKQIQLEQDTAKTILQPPSTYLLDFNRVGTPLIEIITLPQIHSPTTASACVRKIQSLLRAVDACVVGMEMGGLRCDVNVSVRERGTTAEGLSEYAGVKGLGTRTEIKNLSSFKAVEDAILAERDRQIAVLESGGEIEGETRGWTIGQTETVRLRGKEGEVDYRYMPDPDLGPLIIGQDLVDHLKDTLPMLPDETAERVVNEYGISAKDARTLISLDDGDRLEYTEAVVETVMQRLASLPEKQSFDKVGKVVADWVLHELGGLLTTAGVPWETQTVTPERLADIIVHLQTNQITGNTAKKLLAHYASLQPVAEAAIPSVSKIIDTSGLRLVPLTEGEYIEMAQKVMAENPDMVKAVREKGQKGKIMWFVGQMMRRGEEGRVEAEKARSYVERLLEV